MKRHFLAFVLVVSIQCIYAQNNYPLFEDPIHVTQFQLKNGLTVVLSENHEKPTIMGAIVVKAGGKNDPADATGIAHYLEHMLFKGTRDLGTTDYTAEKVYLDKIDSLYEVLGKTHDEESRVEIQKQINEQSIKAGEFAIPNEMDGMLSEIGSKGVNAFTTNDMTVYHNEFPSNQLQEWLSIYSHRFENPVFRLFQSELETVYEEKNRGLESPFNYAFEAFMKNFYKKHPYGQQTVIGKTAHLKNPSLKKMYDFYNTYYVANNMVLIMTGDFQTDELKSLIEHYFSGWKSGPLPEYPTYKEDNFKAGESLTIRATPIKAFARGYRTPKFGEYDEIALNIISNLLNNDQHSGIFDELVDDGKIMEIQNIYEPMEDYGASIFMVIPKILGQSFDEANVVLDSAIAKLTTGNFSNELFEGAKNQWILDYESDLEDNSSRTYLLADVYGNQKNWFEYVNFIKAIKDIKKDELVMIAKKYYSQNYFTLYSKMGKHKEEKLKKPGFAPIIPKSKDQHSSYYTEWKKIHSDIEPRELISLKTAIQFEELNNNIQLKTVHNPVNEIFDLNFIWKEGYREHPELEMLSEFLNSSTTSNLSLNDFKNKLYALGTTIEWRANEHTFELSVTGLDDNMDVTISTLKDFLQSPTLTKSKIQTIAKQVALNRKLNFKEPQFQASVLAEYARYGDRSKFLLQPSASDFKNQTVEQFNQLYAHLKDYQLEINYAGTHSTDEIAQLLEKLSLTSGSENSDDYVYPVNDQPYDVYFLNNKKSVQSHVYFVGDGKPFQKENTLPIHAFNYYFGFDMSSILFQEIREFRSLAYSTYGYVNGGRNPKNTDKFTAYVGCQGDKTKEAAGLLHQLIQKMPIKLERQEMLKNSLTNLIENSNPSFRDYISLYENSINKGFDDNYYITLKSQLSKFDFNDMLQYYQTEIQPLKLKMAILGNSSRFKSSLLNAYGKVKKVSVKQIYRP